VPPWLNNCIFSKGLCFLLAHPVECHPLANSKDVRGLISASTNLCSTHSSLVVRTYRNESQHVKCFKHVTTFKRHLLVVSFIIDCHGSVVNCVCERNDDDDVEGHRQC